MDGLSRRLGTRRSVRGAGGAPWTPAALGASCIVWFSAERSAITIGTGVSEISNLGSDGVAMNAVQATTTKQPAWLVGATPNGRHALDFDGVNDALKTLQRSAASAQPYAIAGVLKSDVTTAGRTPWDGDNNTGNRSALLVQSGTLWQGYSGALLTSPSTTTTAWQAVLVEHNNTSGAVYVDNGTPTTGAIGTEQYRGTTLGAFVDQVTSPFDGKIAEYLVINRLLTGSERGALHAYFRSEWGI